MPRRAVLALVLVSLLLIGGGAMGLAAGRSSVRAGTTAPLTATGAPTAASAPAPADPSPPPDVPSTGVSTPDAPTREIGTRPGRLADVAAAEPGTEPARLRMPSLEVDAPIDPVGVYPDGSMELPDDVRRLGWYRFGARPGSGTGAVVVSGHVDDREQGPGALFELGSVEPGAQVVVELGDGTSKAYKVVGRERFTKQALPVERIFRRDGAEVLALITCGGPFDAETRSYRDNVLVVAEPAGE